MTKFYSSNYCMFRKIFQIIIKKKFFKFNRITKQISVFGCA